MARPGPGRLALGLALGAAAAAGLGLSLLWALRRRRQRRGWRRGGGGGREAVGERAGGTAGLGDGGAEAAGSRNQALPRKSVPVEAGDCAVYAPLLTHGEQVDVLDRLDFVLTNISELRKEVEELRNSLQHLAADIVGEVRSHLEETQRVTRRRRFPFHRERSDSTGSSSIYFTANSGATNTDDGESEGGYTTANAESDYDRESEKESEEGEDELSCETVRTARRDSLDLVNEDETHLILDSSLDEGLGQLLQQADHLHSGDEQEKREGFQLLLNNKLAYGDQGDFLWRLARAHSDMYDITEDTDERKSYASDGKEELEVAFQKWDQSAECHQWYAILCGQLAEHESIQKRIQTGYIFKEHIDKAIALKPEDPKSYYLLGRWCYQVSHLGWLEKKTAAALFETPPTATVQDALQNFLKVEELSPGFSKAVRVYIAKCYKDLGNNSAALLWMNLASELPANTKEDSETERELEEMRSTLEE